DGAFVAFNDTEHYTGGVDKYGNVVMFTTRLTTGTASRFTAPPPGVVHVIVKNDYIPPDDRFEAEKVKESLWQSFRKSNVSVTQDPGVEPDSLTWTTEEPSSTGSGEFAADSTGLAEPSGAQGGLPDWPLVPITSQPPTAASFMVQVASGTLAAGAPTAQLTPWLDSASITASPGVTPAASTTTTITTPGAVTPSAPSSPAPAPVGSTAVPTVSTIVAAGPTASKQDTGSDAPWIIVVVVLAAAAGFVVAEITGQILGLLQRLPVGDMLTGGWGHLKKVGEARSATKADGSSRAVSLLKHEVSFSHESTVEMLLDELPMELLELVVNASFAIEGCELVITNGEVVRAHPGPTAANASLQARGVTLLEHAVAIVDPSRLFDNAARAEPS
ncbi:MAG TPA: hypothetical protein VHN36_18785, partial [Ilumatobacteraceae bacterium]|nr:hypothetical protein [Ilumatobacteraceae bacterium]